jgi:hypothetical protein
MNEPPGPTPEGRRFLDALQAAPPYTPTNQQGDSADGAHNANQSATPVTWTESEPLPPRG